MLGLFVDYISSIARWKSVIVRTLVWEENGDARRLRPLQLFATVDMRKKKRFCITLTNASRSLVTVLECITLDKIGLRRKCFQLYINRRPDNPHVVKIWRFQKLKNDARKIWKFESFLSNFQRSKR